MTVVNRDRLAICEKCDTAIQYKDKERKEKTIISWESKEYYSDARVLQWEIHKKEIKCLYITCSICNHDIRVFEFLDKMEL